MAEADIYCAHNIKMERHFFSGGDHRWICTYRCAVAIWPDFESHTNQGVRYHLGIDLVKELAEPPHRALPDAYVTAHILLECLEHRSLQELIDITAKPILLKRIGFGKHRGTTFEELAKTQLGYLKWMLGQDFDEDIKFTIKHWLGAR